MNDTNTIHIDTKKIYASLNEVWQFIKANKDISTDSNKLTQLREMVAEKINNACRDDYFTPALFDLAYAIMLDSAEGINDNFVIKDDTIC